MNRWKMSQPVETAQFCDSFPPIMDGVGRVAKEYAENIRERLGPTSVIVPWVPGCSDDSSSVLRFPSVPIPGRKPYRYGVPWVNPLFVKRVTDIPLQLVHSHSPFVAGSLALQVASKRGIPVVASFHTKYLDDVRRMFPRVNFPAETVRRHLVDFYNRVDQVWVPNNGTCDTLREYGYRGSIEVVENGTDISVPADPVKARKKAEVFLGISPETKLLTYIGQIVYEKNLKFLIDSLKALNDTGTQYQFVFVGEGYARPELQNLVQEMGLSNVKFTGVVRDRELIVSMLSRTHCLVFPSLYDTSPLVLREAAALGVPSLLLKGSTASEGVIDEGNGFLGEQESVRYAEKLKAILTNPELRDRVGVGAHGTFYRTWGQVADEVAERYLDLIRQSNKRDAIIA